MTPQEIEQELWLILNKVRRLRPAHALNLGDFHNDKSDAATAILRLIDGVKGKRRPRKVVVGRIVAWRDGALVREPTKLTL
jgi:hypothetical protein